MDKRRRSLVIVMFLVISIIGSTITSSYAAVASQDIIQESGSNETAVSETELVQETEASLTIEDVEILEEIQAQNQEIIQKETPEETQEEVQAETSTETQTATPEEAQTETLEQTSQTMPEEVTEAMSEKVTEGMSETPQQPITEESNTLQQTETEDAVILIESEVCTETDLTERMSEESLLETPEETDLIRLYGERPTSTVGETFTIFADVQVADTASYQWQIQQKGTEWTDIEGMTETQYTILTEGSSYTSQYRLVVTDVQGKQYASKAFVLVKGASEEIEETDQIQIQHTPDAILAGFPFSMTADTQIPEMESFQWQVQQEGTEWTDIEGATETVYEFMAEEASYLNSYRFVVTDTQGKRYASFPFKPEKAVCYVVPDTRDASVSAYSELKDALEKSGTIFLTSDITISKTLYIEPLTGTRTITIKSDRNQSGAPFRLLRDTTGNMFSIADNIRTGKVNLTFADVILDGNDLEAADDCMLYVRQRGTMTLGSGAVVQNAKGSGAVYIEHATSGLNPGGHLIMNSGSVIQNCSAQNGGAIYVSGGGGPGTLTVDGGTFIGNTAENNGGAICGDEDSRITVSNAAFQNNSASKAGGAVFLSGTSDQTAFSGCTFSGNSTTGNDTSESYYNKGGGAVAILADRHASFTDCQFTNNQSATSGGALLTAGTGKDSDKRGDTHVDLSGCSLTGNTASGGGGGLATFWVATVSMDNTSISNNSASSGGGIYSGEIDGCFGQVTIHSGTIAGNTATSGTGAGIHTGANNKFTGGDPLVGRGYMSVLKLGAGLISIQDEVYMPMSNAHIEVFNTKSLNLPRGEQIPVRIGRLPDKPANPNEIGPDGNGAVVAAYPGYNTAVDSLSREELLKFRYTLPGHGFLMGRDVLGLSGSPNITDPELWSNSIRVVWEHSVQEQVGPIKDLYVHSQYGVDPSEEVVARALNLQERGTESRPLQSIYMAYCIANEYNTADEITVHLMDTQNLGEYGVPASMELTNSKYTDEKREVTLTGSNRKIKFVRHKAAAEIPQFTGKDEQQYLNTDNQNALFKLDRTENLILDGVTVDGRKIAVPTADAPAALVSLHGEGAALTVQGGAVLQNNQDRAIHTAQGSVILNGAAISGNTSSDGEGNGIWQGSSSTLRISGELSVADGQEIWLNADAPEETAGAKITVTGAFTLTDLKKLPVDFPNYVNRKVVAAYEETLAAPDDAETEKYQVDEEKLNAAGLAVSHEGQEILLIQQQPFSFYKYGASADGQGKQPLKGAKFWLYGLTCTQEHTHETYIDFTKDAGCWSRTKEAVSDENGRVDFGYLRKGTYLLVEAETDYQYENPLNQWSIEINPEAAQEKDAVKITTVVVGTETPVEFVSEQKDSATVWTLTNQKKNGSDFSFIKQDKDSGERLSGVGFTLYYCPYSWMPGHVHAEAPTEGTAAAGECWRIAKEVSTKKDGLADFGQIPDGTYLLKEAYTKSNYYLPEGHWEIVVDSSNTEMPIQITQKGEQQPEIKKETDRSYTLKNQQRTDGMEFSFTKTDEAENPLNHAGFSLWKLRCTDPTHVTITDHDNYALWSEFAGGSATECWEPMPLWINGQQKKLFMSGENDALGVVTGAVEMGFLENGTYCLMEDLMPAGYGDNSCSGQWIWGVEINSETEELSKRVVVTSLESAYGVTSPSFQVQVNPEGTGTVTEQTTVSNKKKTGTPFSFYKMDADTGAPMEGVCFDLYLCLNEDVGNEHGHSDFVTEESVASGNCWIKVGSAVSDSTGKVDFGEIIYTFDSFRLVESRTLEGYKLPKTQWDVVANGDSLAKITPVAPEGETPLEFTKDEAGNYVLKNKKPRAYPVDFMKVDGDKDVDGDTLDSPLPGASFQLYVCENETAGHVHDELASEKSIKNGCWKPMVEDGKPKICTSGEDGMIHLELFAGDYMLVETEAPFGYHLPKGQILLRVTDVGTNGGMEFIAKGEDAPDYWDETNSQGIAIPKIGNKKEPGASISFSKTDAEDINHFLAGAEFKIYTCANKDPNHVHEELASAESAEKSCWKPVQENGQDKVFVSEGTYGIVNTGFLPYGEYMLVETAVPDGYQLPDGQWHIVLEKGKYWASNVTVKGKAPEITYNTQMGTGIIQPCIPNKKKVSVILPDTGGTGTTALYLLGLTLLAGSGISFCFRRKRKA